MSTWTAVSCAAGTSAERPTTSSNSSSFFSLKLLKDHLPPNWDACSMVDGRLFYIDHYNETTHWVPPVESWICRYGLPYSWEIAIDTTGKPYYINHCDEETTYNDPRMELNIQPPEPRDVVLQRDAQLGFGFVAGSEKPVVVRFVTDGGPSSDKLLPGDEIWLVNGEDVRDAAKDHVVQLVRNCSQEVRLCVCQKQTVDSNVKSAILSATKRARLKNNPCRVRFAEGVLIGTPPDTPRGTESCVALMPNVLRVFLENGQTKSFKYDQTTTVQDVMENMQEKLGLRCIEHFALTLEHPQGPRSNKLSLLRRDETIAKIAARPGSQHFRCLFRVIFVPNDSVDLLKSDPIAFEYLYQQCVNDVVQGRYAFEMRYEACLRLAALHMQQCSIDNHCNNNGRVSLKAIEKEYGLNTFLPSILLENVKLKEIRKHLRYYLKKDVSQPPSLGGTPNHHSPLPFEQSSNSLHGILPLSSLIKVKYIHMLGHLPSFGGRAFYVTFKETNTDMMMQIGPKTGITVRNTGRNVEVLTDMTKKPTFSLFYDLIAYVSICAESEVLRLLSIKLKNDQTQTLDFLVDKDCVDDLVLLMQGYYLLFTGEHMPVHWEEEFSEPPVPPYLGLHSVRVSNWNYSSNHSFTVDEHKEHLVDLSRGPPKYKETVTEIPVRRFSKENTSESVALLKSPSRKGSGASTTLVDVQLHSTKVVSRKNSADSQEDLDTYTSSLSNPKRTPNRKSRADEAGFVRKTFLKARDSLIIRNRSNSRSKDLVHVRSKSTEHDGPTSVGNLSEVSGGSDTESLSTPSESPIHRISKHGRPLQLPVNGKNHSFGLQSPDTLPCSLLSDVELQQIIASCGLEGQQLEDLLLLFPDNFCADSEIIDLTILPPPKTPDGVPNEFDVAEPIKPPTPFADLDPQQDFDLHHAEIPINDLHPQRHHRTTPASAAKHLMRRHLIDNVAAKKDPPKLPTEFYEWLMQAPVGEPCDVGKSSAESSRFPSIDNKEEFEKFLRRHIVPPPPSRSCDDGLLKFDDRNRKMPSSMTTGGVTHHQQPVRRVSFSADVSQAEVQRKPHTGPLERKHQAYHSSHHNQVSSVRNERIIPVLQQTIGGKLGGHDVLSARATTDGNVYPRTYTTSSTIVERDVVVNDLNLRKTRSDSASGKRQDSVNMRDSTDLIQEYHPQTSTGEHREYDVRSLALRDFTGLEESEHSPPEVKSMPLSHFVGLESGDTQLMDHSKTNGKSGSHETGSSLDRYTRIDSPSHQKSKRAGFSEADTLDNVSELSFAAERSESSRVVTYGYNTSESRYPNYLYHRRRSGTAGPAEDSMWPTNEDATAHDELSSINTNGSLPSDEPVCDAKEEDYERAKDRICHLVEQLKDQLDDFPAKSPRRIVTIASQKARCKNALLNEAQQFAAAGKMLVRCVTEPRGSLLPAMEQACEKAKCVHDAALLLIVASDGLFQAQTLGAKVREVLVAFERTLDAAKNARGKPLGDAEMKRLMRQSTTLAATLTQLIRTVRES